MSTRTHFIATSYALMFIGITKTKRLFIYRRKEAKSGIPLEVYRRLGGTFKDCWEARQDVVDGKYVALCDDTTIIKVMAWDFR